MSSGKEIPGTRSQLSPAKRALLEQWRGGKNTLTSDAETIRRRPIREFAVLSFAQERLWFLDQLQPGNTAYNMPGPVRLTGPLNVVALEQSLSEIVRRHDALRTSFASVDEQPVQVIAPAMPFTLPVVDLGKIPETEREDEARRLTVKEAQRPFDLAQGPLIRASLVRLDKDDHLLLLTMHHIISDGWSMGVLFQELSGLYRAFCAGEPSPLPELPIQYADFAVWQRQWLQGEVLASQLSYWKQQLAEAPSVLELPTDRPRPAVQTFCGAWESMALSQTLSEGLRALSRRERVTLSMVLLAAFKTVLCRYTGQDDIVVGSPIANRNRAEIEGLIGFFVNTLILRTDLSGNPTFQELLGKVREVCLGAYAHQDLPFEKLVDELQPKRDLSRTPLSQAMFNMLNLEARGLELHGLTVERWPSEPESMFDLTLNVRERGEEIHLQFIFNTDLFDTGTITRMLGHYQTLLQGIVANPEQRLSDLPLLTDAEQHQLLVEWNNTRTDSPMDKCLHELFEDQAERTPDNIAVVFEDQQVTYRELNSRANQLAHHLRSLGVGPEVLVGICVERSIEMVVGILSILKAGGAYVPLDPDYPKERLAFMLEDTQAPVLLTQQRLLESLPDRGAKVVCLDTHWETIGQESDDNPISQSVAGNLAYVIYTSGSTGIPKGVLVNHSNVTRLFTATDSWFHFNQKDVWTLFHSFAFDFSVWELWGALLHGGRLVVIPYWVSRSPESFYQLLCTHEVTVLNQTPSVFRQLMRGEQSLDGTNDLYLRLIIFGGEALELQSLKPWFDRHGDQHPQLVNMYGITETTVHVTYRPLTTADLNGASGSAVGSPIPDLQVYLLDKHFQPVPIGIPGEMYVGGAGLARGYLNSAELTVEKFIPNPFSDKPGASLYKSGDLARYRPDGDIEFLGRVDNQVKIRGFRIELGEIETVLDQHPAVQETVVIAREEVPGDKRLVAYVVPKQEPNATAEALRTFLQEKMPNYMMPSTFVFLDALPLTPNGKVDRKALPVSDGLRPDLEGVFVPPRNPVEETLAGIWAQLLRVDRVGVHDNFFELGGDSILGIQIIARANQAGIQLTPKQLFQHQTIAELATVAGNTTGAKAEQGLVLGQLPLTPIQRWFFEHGLVDPNHWNQSILLELRETFDPALLEKVVQHLLLHHDALRLRFIQGESGWRQFNTTPHGPPPFSRMDLSALPESQQGLAIEATATQLQASLNLSEGPLLRVTLFDLGTDRPARLLVIIHHLAVDGVSWRILLEGLQTLYRQLSDGRPVQLPPKTTSFKHWAERLTEYAKSAALRKELDYWLEDLQGSGYGLPLDYPGGTNSVASARAVSGSLSAEETRALLQEVPEVYHTQINDVLLTALVQAFSQWTGKSSLLVDLEGHGREDIIQNVDLSRTVGWFTSCFPVLLDLKGASHPGEALKVVKEHLRHIPNRGIGYGLLRYLSGNSAIVEPLRALPQPEVSFNYLGQFDQMLPESSPITWARESMGPTHSLRGHRPHLLVINSIVARNRLEVRWLYSGNIHRYATIKNLSENFLQALRSLIDHCRSPEAGGYTPSDFPAADLSQKELDDLIEELPESE